MQEKKRREDEEAQRNRDRWVHWLEMQTNSHAPLTASSTRDPGVSAIPAPDCSNMLISANQSSPPLLQQGVGSSLQVPLAIPEQTGSFVPLAISANLRNRNEELFEIAGCFRCGGNHHEFVCQQKDPWEYIAPFFGSVDFGQGFFSIPVIETDFSTN
jgi:hypothetical protein